ncbi:uncharacterized protein MONBRDRAFT_32820 [Monosiga brevicollis MX1]|uniref:Uncharacterized protein n=1 Tax=Monosiga brevicollis TaxID=81824 RepID=A9V1W8_MONBE|nr:uncharacterized protein MONBRDRAFT_32820 [Monosiga brevicollis MX1]EDQ88636.1 predicted protein [Monosiga brevicollis MX1]|eukprot:XP_001746740.1 hypothetical protein [Monosiga brevicollis MX1]
MSSRHRRELTSTQGQVWYCSHSCFGVNARERRVQLLPHHIVLRHVRSGRLSKDLPTHGQPIKVLLGNEIPSDIYYKPTQLPEQRFVVRVGHDRHYQFLATEGESATAWRDRLLKYYQQCQDGSCPEPEPAPQTVELSEQRQSRRELQGQTEHNEELLKTAVRQELRLVDANALPVAPSEDAAAAGAASVLQADEAQFQSMLERGVKEVKELESTFNVLGYRLNTWGYLGVTYGTSLGLSITLKPQPRKERPAPQEVIDEQKHSLFQRALLACLDRGNDMLEQIEDESMELVLVNISATGFGLDIPAITVGLTLADGRHAGKWGATNPERLQQEEHEGRTLWERIVDGTKDILHALCHPFSSLARPVLRTLVHELHEFRDYLDGTGLRVGTIAGHGGWLGITIGTYIGVSMTVVLLDELDDKEFDASKLSTFQRSLLGMMARAHRLATNATGDTAHPVMLRLAISGIGLAVPSMTVTAYLQKIDPEKPMDGHERLLSLPQSQPEATKSEEAAPSSELTTRYDDFVLEPSSSLLRSTTNAVKSVGEATRRAVLATGKAAAKVVGAIVSGVDAVAQEALDVAVSPITLVLGDIEKVEGSIIDLPLEFCKEFATITYGTQFGASLRLQEKPHTKLIEHLEKKLEAAKRTEAQAPKDETRASVNLIARNVRGVLRGIARVPVAAASLRERRAHVDMVSLNADGLGVGIPSFTTSVYFGYTASKQSGGGRKDALVAPFKTIKAGKDAREDPLDD